MNFNPETWKELEAHSNRLFHELARSYAEKVDGDCRRVAYEFMTSQLRLTFVRSFCIGVGLDSFAGSTECCFCGRNEPSIISSGDGVQVICAVCGSRGPLENDNESAMNHWKSRYVKV